MRLLGWQRVRRQRFLVHHAPRALEPRRQIIPKKKEERLRRGLRKAADTAARERIFWDREHQGVEDVCFHGPIRSGPEERNAFGLVLARERRTLSLKVAIQACHQVTVLVIQAVNLGYPEGGRKERERGAASRDPSPATAQLWAAQLWAVGAHRGTPTTLQKH